MSNFINDTLERQIAREEVWFGQAGTIAIDVGASDYYFVGTGSKECQVRFELLTEATTIIQITEGISDPVTGDVTLFNMRRTHSASIETEFAHENVSPGGGSPLWGWTAIDGKVPQNSPLNQEAGMILKANTWYEYKFLNDGVSAVTYSVNVFLREL